MTPTSLVAAAVAPRTGKINKNGVFLKEDKILYKMVYQLNQSSEIVVQSFHRRKTEFSERGLVN